MTDAYMLTQVTLMAVWGIGTLILYRRGMAEFKEVSRNG